MTNNLTNPNPHNRSHIAEVTMTRRAYVDIPEGQVHYQTAGSGEPILLLHQTPQSSDEYAMCLMPILAEKYHVIAMDLETCIFVKPRSF
jgi:hypothetical protein